MTEAAPPRPKSRIPVVLFVIVGMFVLLFVAWQRDWFGRPLSDDQILAALDLSGGSDREIQHGLAQLEQRLHPGYPGRERFREKVTALAKHSRFEIRRQAAWTMGREPAPEYQAALRLLLQDTDLGTQRNAACALSNFNDGAGREILLQALDPVVLRAPSAGELDLKLKSGDAVSIGRALGRVRTATNDEIEIRAPFDGYVEALPAGRKAEVALDAEIVRISPDPESVLNSLVALRFVGLRQDAEKLAPFADGKIPRMPREVTTAARETRTLLQGR